MTYRIAIPSYQRARTLRAKTLRLLYERGVDPDRIDIFVADEEQRRDYESTLEPFLYGNLITAVPGMGAVRNFITNWYPVGKQVLNLDDDLDDVVERLDEKRVRPIEDLHQLIEQGFRISDKTGLRLWGIYPVPNPYFMKPRLRLDLTYIEGAFWGTTIGRGEECYVTLNDKEDFERTLRYYVSDGGVIRLEDVAMQTNFYTEPGGMQHDGERTDERVAASAHRLVEMFPDLVSINNTKKSGKVEVRLRDKR